MSLSKSWNCKLCGLAYSEEKGRLRGKVFTCTGCSSHVRLLQRNLGENTGLSNFSAEEQKTFFKSILQKKKESPNGRISWQTVRASLIQAETTRSMQSFKAEVSGKQLPLSVWVQQGWSEDIVQRCPKEHSEELGCEVFTVPVREMTWSEHFERCQKQILRHEQEAHKNRGKRGQRAGEDGDPDSDLDLPAAPAAGSTSSKEEKPESEKKALARRQKLLRENDNVANKAAKAMGGLQNSFSALSRAWEKLEKKSVEVPAGVSELVKDLLGKLESWAEACRATVNDHESSRKLWQNLGGDLLPLNALPFSAEDLKILLGQVTEAKKSLTELVPKKEKKTKESSKDTSASEPPAKRVRRKGGA
eukprot:Skav224274  [mRNA]  locus=scaffold217:52282:53364:+ [translate_table: standard]